MAFVFGVANMSVGGFGGVESHRQMGGFLTLNQVDECHGETEGSRCIHTIGCAPRIIGKSEKGPENQGHSV